MDERAPARHPHHRRVTRGRVTTTLFLVAMGIGVGGGYLAAERSPAALVPSPSPPGGNQSFDQAAVVTDLGLDGEYTLPVSYGTIGSELVAVGAIDYERFVGLYEQRGRALAEDQLAVLSGGSDDPIVIDHDNAYFLLNLFWAFGLTNDNPLLEEGPMAARTDGEIGRFASTGGWTLGARPPMDLYSAVPIVVLSPQQQARLEEVALGVFRPCCDNPTAFPDCNHGMAMLGLLELMASRDSTVEEMFDAARHINAFWFPQQTMAVAQFFEYAMGETYMEVDARTAVGPSVFSASGFGRVHQWLVDNGLLRSSSGSGAGCSA